MSSTPISAVATNQFSEPGILTTSKTVRGTVYETYSDGFTTQYTLKGYRKEHTKDGSGLEAFPSDSDDEEWIDDILPSPAMNQQNSATYQSRLRQKVEANLNYHHASKALEASKRYLEIQKIIEASGLPLAIAYELLGEVKLQLGQKTDAMALLTNALATASKLNNEELRKQLAMRQSVAKRQAAFSKKNTKTVSGGKPKAAAENEDDPDIRESAKALSKLPGLPNITLHFDSYTGCSFQTAYHPGTTQIRGRLLTIDGVTTHGLTRNEVFRLLEGLPGSSVAITFLNEDEKEQISLTREPAKKFGEPPYSKQTFLSAIDGFDESSREYRNDVNSRLQLFRDRNFDIFIRAAATCSLRDAITKPGTDDIHLAHEAGAALMALDSVGAFKQANRLIPLSKKDTTFVPERTYNSAHSKNFINALASTGRLADAEYFCNEYLKESNPVNDDSQAIASPHIKRTDSFEAKQLYADLLVREKSPKAATALTQIFDALNKLNGFPNNNGQDVFWLPEKLEEVGEYEKARIWYSEAIKQFQLMQKAFPQKISIDVVRQQAYYAWHVANLQFIEKRNAAAIATIDAAIAEYDRNQKPEQQAIVNQLGFFFPTRNDLVLKREAIFANKSMPQIPSGAEGSFDSEFKLLTLCHQKIESNDKSVSTSITQLLQRYEERLPELNYQTRPLSMFSALLNVARDLADHKSYVESDRLLNALQTLAISKERAPTLTLLPEIELALNADSQKHKSNILWHRIEHRLRPDHWSTRFPTLANNPQMTYLLELLAHLEANRQLANIYSKAGEPERASRFIQRAVEISNSLKRSIHGPIDKSLLARFNIILLLDRAEIDAQSGHFRQALNESTEAIRLCSLTKPATTDQLNRVFNDTYRTKLTEVATIFSARQNKKEDAIRLLRLANATINTGATAYIPSRYDTSIFHEKTDALIDTCLAQLLFETGQYREALPLVKRAVSAGQNSVSSSTLYLAGEIAEKCNSFDQAAHFFSLAEVNFNDYFDNHIRKNAGEEILRRAMDCCRKASLKNAESGNIALRLGQLLELSNPQEALANYQFTLPLIGDDDPKKLALLGRIQYVRTLIKSEEQAISSALNTIPVNSTQSSSSKGNSTRKTEEQMIAEEINQNREKLGTLQTIAELAEKSNRPDEWQKWIELATAQAQVGLLGDAVTSAHHGIRKYKRAADTNYFFPSTLLPAGGFRCLPDALRRQGRGKDAELLLDEAVDKILAEHGSGSSDVARQLANTFSYLVAAKDDVRALRALDQILALPPRVLELGGPYNSCLERIYHRAENSREERTSLARTILQRVIDSQLQQLGADDYRLSTSRIELAKLATKIGDFPTAERELLEAIRIRTLFLGIRAISEQAGELQKLLPKVGREAENVWIRESYDRQWCPSLLRKFGYVAEADSLEKTGEVPKNYIDPPYPYEHHRLEGNVDWQTEADRASKQAPFSARAFRANENLLRSSLASMDWETLEKSCSALTNIYEHSSDLLAGRSYGCVPPDSRRIDYYLGAAKASYKLGKTEEAKNWIKRAEKILPDLSSWEWQQLGALEIELGDKVVAARLLDNALTLLTQQYSAVGSSLPSLYSSIDKPESAEKASKRLQELRLTHASQQAEENSQSNIFKHVQF